MGIGMGMGMGTGDVIGMVRIPKSHDPKINHDHPWADI
jgi:hypothetical protein